MVLKIIANLNGGDLVTPDNKLTYRIYGSADNYASPIATLGSALNDAKVSVTAGIVTIENVDIGTEDVFKIYSVDEAGNEAILSDSSFDYNANYKAVLNYADSESITLPNDTIKLLQNDFAISINPFFNKFAELHFFAGEAGKSGFKSIDWARLNKADYYNSPTFLARGVKGNGTSSYVDLLFDANTETTIDSLTFGFFAPDEIVFTGSDDSIMGSVGTNDSGILYRKRKDNFGIQVSCNSEINNTSNKTTKDLISVSSDGSTIILRRDENTQNTFTLDTQTQSTGSIILLGERKAGDVRQFTDGLISLSFITNTELTVSELGILSTAIKTYLNSI